MNTEIKTICGWCKTIIKDGPEIDGQVSHGICNDCVFEQKQIMRFRDECGFDVSELTDSAIWKVYKNSMLMAIIRIKIQADELKKAISKVGFSVKEITDGFKKVKEIIDAKNP